MPIQPTIYLKWCTFPLKKIEPTKIIPVIKQQRGIGDCDILDIMYSIKSSHYTMQDAQRRNDHIMRKVT